MNSPRTLRRNAGKESLVTNNTCSNRTIELAAGQILAVDAGRGTRLCVRSGRAWLTQERDDRDVVLGAGRAVTLGADGVLVVQMLRAGTLVIDAEDRAVSLANSWLRRICARLQFAPKAGHAPVVAS
jgi:hypothetical protein